MSLLDPGKARRRCTAAVCHRAPMLAAVCRGVGWRQQGQVSGFSTVLFSLWLMDMLRSVSKRAASASGQERLL
jgi:hypothetical protein